MRQQYLGQMGEDEMQSGFFGAREAGWVFVNGKFWIL